ncbi:hypothetical protein AWC38_SpisGene5764 [Stylophora pistillata]|uniref:Uncharacterized protein n=1 Tax=Stylophora pistillata TaxID=50429 RepID=A0A2B4SKR4_STYPI|nr:hypothetical protein AWC38_SpisGene5764 [Stylophora pistillata]
MNKQERINEEGREEENTPSKKRKEAMKLAGVLCLVFCLVCIIDGKDAGEKIFRDEGQWRACNSRESNFANCQEGLLCVAKVEDGKHFVTCFDPNTGNNSGPGYTIPRDESRKSKE